MPLLTEIHCFQLQPEYIRTLSEVLHHAGNSPVARVAAGLQLKNLLTAKDATLKSTYQARWLSIPQEIRLYVKKNVSYIFSHQLNKIVSQLLSWNFSLSTIAHFVTG